ncbi:MAG TPA: anthranilate phosphoribosyltransferase [Pyrinomonadaceae bacterium]|nr:anthranilate phosphoribosyltransferase [Pyrinomonadaceae bacterium]
MPQNQLQQFLSRLVRSEDLSRDEATQFLEALLEEEVTDVQIAAALTALATKGETVEELAGLATGLRSKALHLECRHERFIDTAGTGSSHAKTFNISTAAAFVIAASGLPVAKHGNRAASSKSGSADVLTALGINVSALPSISETALNEIGICFMFAPLYHGATARVAGIRRQMGVRTTFNLLGPLSNPASAPRQIIGVWERNLVQRLANALALLGTERSWVVHGEDGLDEITLQGKTFVAEAYDGSVRTFEIEPTDFDLNEASLEHLRGGDPDVNARMIREVFEGKRKDEARSLIAINAAAALVVGEVTDDLRTAAHLALKAIDSGAAWEKLELLRMATRA